MPEVIFESGKEFVEAHGKIQCDGHASLVSQARSHCPATTKRKSLFVIRSAQDSQKTPLTFNSLPLVAHRAPTDNNRVNFRRQMRF